MCILKSWQNHLGFTPTKNDIPTDRKMVIDQTILQRALDKDYSRMQDLESFGYCLGRAHIKQEKALDSSSCMHWLEEYDKKSKTCSKTEIRMSPVEKMSIHITTKESVRKDIKPIDRTQQYREDDTKLI